MAGADGEYIYTTIHEFKNNISRYLRDLEGGRMRAVVIKRYDREIAFCMAMNAGPREEAPQEEPEEEKLPPYTGGDMWK